MAKRKRKRIASRGSVNTTILKTLINGDKYGYEIIKEVEEYSDGKIVLKQPSLYSSLSRFEDKGIVTSYWGDSDIGGRRHYYHLTEKGHKFYQTEVLKIKDEDVEEINETEKLVSDTHGNIKNTLTEPIEDIVIKEIDEKEIPAIATFETNKQEEIIPDHQFFTKTPIDNVISNTQSELKPVPTEIVTIKEQTKETPWQKLARIVKASNIRCANTPFRKLHYIRPKKAHKVILDTDGIYKLRDEDYIPNRQKSKPVIIDNVVKRTNSTAYGYGSYTDQINNNSTRKEFTELSEEEKRQRNENFLNKFNLLTKTRIEEKEILNPKTPTPQVKEEKEEHIDYRNKLDKLMFLEENKQTPHIQENNLFNYVEEEKEDKFVEFEDPQGKQEEEDKFIDFEPTEFDIKNENKKYIEEINNITTTNETIKINRYENNASRNITTQDRAYVLINKVRCVFGVILLALMVAEITISLFVFKKLEFITKNDNVLFIVAYAITGIIALSYILPIIFNSNEHKLNNFKLRYSFIFGLLTFLVSVILIYCVNALMGFDLDNFSYFAVKLILPAILTFNFVIAPLIYSAVIKSKRFYD